MTNEPTLRVTVPPDVLFRDLDGEAVVLELATGRYYGLNEVGTRIWHLLAEHGELAKTLETLLEEYDAPEERLRRDLLELVDALAARGLLEVDGS